MNSKCFDKYRTALLNNDIKAQLVREGLCAAELQSDHISTMCLEQYQSTTLLVLRTDH